ncbi:hypothetical protein B7463_g5756, partial [Scytalidium lignicola]
MEVASTSDSTTPLVRFYELSGPKSWSPFCCCTKYALNYKRIPYETVKLSYPAISPTCTKLFPDMTNLKATVPIIEILGEDYEVLNNSTPIAKLLNQRFPESAGFRDLKGLDKIDAYAAETSKKGSCIFGWVVFDVYENALDKTDGSREFFRRTREESEGCRLEDITQVVDGGEDQLLEAMRKAWAPLRERMQGEDGTGEPTYLDFYDASHFRWVEASSAEKGKKLMDLFGDDTFEKLLKKVEPYSF